MNYPTRLDLFLGGFMDKVFSLRKHYQPIDLARMLLREVTTNERKTLKQTFAPNILVVLLAEPDMERLEPIYREVVNDLKQTTEEFIERQELNMTGPLSLAMEASPELKKGQVRIKTSFTKGV